MDNSERIKIPSEPVGSIPRSNELMAAISNYRCGKIDRKRLDECYTKAIQSTIKKFQDTGSEIITDGEQSKPSFLTYPIFELFDECYAFTTDCFALQFTDGHQRVLPRLIKAPFRYAVYAHTYIDVARRFTKLPIKQAVISPSALSMVYPTATIEGYSRDQFLADLINESEKDIRLCLEKGAHCIQIDFTEARFSLKIDPSGELLRDFISLNNQVFKRFDLSERHRLGVHVCPGGDQDSYHSFEVNYSQVLPMLFELFVGNFYLQLTSEPDREGVLACIRQYVKPWQRIFVGVVNPVDSKVETPEEVCARILEAVKYIPLEQLGTTDDCGFSPFDDDQSTSRQIAFDKIRARIKGTNLAEKQLMAKRRKKT